MKFIDLQTQYQKINQAMDAAIARVLQHGQFIMGPEIQELEAALAHYVGVSHCILMSSGTTALQVALMALGVKAGDEVITTPFSFFATAEVILLLGAKPVFVDIDQKTYNINPKKLEAAITPRTKAIMPVSLYGQCADYRAINAIASSYGIPVIEDGAQSFGAQHHGKRSCGLTTIGCTSFFPSKPLGCYGDGGACFTNDNHLAHEMRNIINHGQEGRYHHTHIGINGRFDTLQAAVVLTKLENFDEEIAARQKVANWYQKYLDPVFTPPYIESHNLSVFAQYTVQVENRASVIAALQQREIPTAVHYPKPLHLQPAMDLVYQHQSFLIAEQMANRVLSLPFHPYMQEDAVKKVAKALEETVRVEA